MFFIVLPVLRESVLLDDSVAHFGALAAGHAARIIVVTTAREAAEATDHLGGADTVTLAARLAARGAVVHLHYPDPHGLKGDQLNFAARYCASHLLGDVTATQTFLVCYDADSRPPHDSLEHFERAIEAFRTASVFHQSSQFELRPGHVGSVRHRSWLSTGIGESAALRANRFVLGFEIPRLVNRSAMACRVKRWLCSYVYAHVTGHGLCLRLSLLLTLPFPARSPLEDMHYSFYLGSRNLPMVAVPSLDRSEVPDTICGQFTQAARWFAGPARFRRYLRDSATQPGMRARLLAASAAGSSVEWLCCAVVPAVTALLVVFGEGLPQWTAIAVVAVYTAQLLVIDVAVGSPAPWSRRAARMLLCPAAMAVFGIGGVVGLIRLRRGDAGVGKTERQ